MDYHFCLKNTHFGAIAEIKEKLLGEKQLVRDKVDGLKIIKICLESTEINNCQCYSLF